MREKSKKAYSVLSQTISSTVVFEQEIPILADSRSFLYSSIPMFEGEFSVEKRGFLNLGKTPVP